MNSEHNDDFNYPDGTHVYPLSTALKTRKTVKNKIITVDQLIKVLLCLSDTPIYGRIMLFKEIFLIYQKLKEKGIAVHDPRFVPYRYGPYSFFVAETLDLMETTGAIIHEGKKNTQMETFKINGKNVKSDEILTIIDPAILEELKKYRKGLDQLGTDGILRKVYQDYPEYKLKSEIKERYKTITWGRGRG